MPPTADYVCSSDEESPDVKPNMKILDTFTELVDHALQDANCALLHSKPQELPPMSLQYFASRRGLSMEGAKLLLACGFPMILFNAMVFINVPASPSRLSPDRGGAGVDSL